MKNTMLLPRFSRFPRLGSILILSLLASQHPGIAHSNNLNDADCGAIHRMAVHLSELNRDNMITIRDALRLHLALSVELFGLPGERGRTLNEYSDRLGETLTNSPRMDNGIMAEGAEAIRRACPMMFN